jgi:hypothetical protein
MMPFEQVLHPDAPRMCPRSSIGDRDARADTGSTHRNPCVSIMLAAASSSATRAHPRAPAHHAVRTPLSMPTTPQGSTPLSP